MDPRQNRLTDQALTTLNAILFILKEIGGKTDFHKLVKILYFADQKHLSKYGSSLSDDYYIPMPNGPVPSLAYDILKVARGDKNLYQKNRNFSKYLRVENRFLVMALVDPDLDYLAESEQEALRESIRENKDLSFNALTRKSHDQAYQNGKKCGEIKVEDIAAAGGANDAMIEYIREVASLKYAHF